MNTIRETYLEHLDQEFNKMIALMLQQLNAVKQQLNGSSSDLMKTEVESREDQIDLIEVTLRDDIISSIVLKSPRASDLRRIMSYYDAVIDIERIADILQSISRRMHYLQKSGSVFPQYIDDARILFDMAEQMLQNAVFAFSHSDNRIAHNIINSDGKLDEAHRKCHKRLFDQQLIGNDAYPHLVADLLDIGRIYYGFERLGDSSTNLAESVIFLTEGIDIKHNK